MEAVFQHDVPRPGSTPVPALVLATIGTIFSTPVSNAYLQLDAMLTLTNRYIYSIRRCLYKLLKNAFLNLNLF